MRKVSPQPLRGDLEQGTALSEGRSSRDRPVFRLCRHTHGFRHRRSCKSTGHGIEIPPARGVGNGSRGAFVQWLSTATADEFRQFLIALGSSGPGVAASTPADTYLATHPIAKSFLESQQPPPVSYATLSYFGVNSFKFTNAQGQVSFGRYRIEPQTGNQFLSEEEIAKAAPGYLAEEIRQRVARAPVRFNFHVQLSEPGDKIDDPSIAWPDTRKTVEIGVIEIMKAVPDSDAAERILIFLPAELPAGIEPGDPMIQARSASYIVSYGRRHQ